MKKFAILSILALLLPLFVSVSVFADSEDVTYNLNSSNVEAVVCRNNDANLPACTDYQYMKFETDFVISNYYSNSMIIAYNGNNKTYLPVNTTVDLSLLPNLTQVYVGATFLTGTNSTATVTLTNSGCPTPEPCPECPLDCDDNFIVSSFKIIFINLVTGIIPTCALIFVVWFFIDMITSFVFGRGR